VGECRRQQAKGRDEHGDHDGPQTKDRALDGGIDDRIAVGSKLVDVFEHDHARLHGDAEQSQKSDARSHTEECMRDKQRDEPADAGHRHGDQNERRPLRRLEHGVENDEDDQDGDRNDD
jgi:hypothetical protein